MVDLRHDSDLRPYEFNIFRGLTRSWVARVSATYVCDFGEHIALAVLSPEGDADILHTVAYVAIRISDFTSRDSNSRSKPAYLRK